MDVKDARRVNQAMKEWIETYNAAWAEVLEELPKGCYVNRMEACPM